MVRHSNVVIVLTVALLCASLATARSQQSRDGNQGTKQGFREVKAAFDAGLKLSSEGKFEAAIGEYRRALAIDPEQPYVLAIRMRPGVDGATTFWVTAARTADYRKCSIVMACLSVLIALTHQELL